MPTLPPFLAPAFSRAGGLLKVLGFPGAGSAETMFDLSDMITDTSAAAAAAAAAQTTANLALNQSTWDSFSFFGDELRYTVGTPIRAIAATVPYNWLTYTTTNLASARFDVQMRPGTWTLNILTHKRPDAANLSVTIDGNLVLNALNLYAAANNFTYLHTITGLTIGTDPIKDIVFLADGHTSPSSSYIMCITKCWGYRTGA